MQHHIIKSLAAIAFGAMMLTATVGCEKENTPVQPNDNDGKISLAHTAWQGRMENPTFDDTYWEEELVFMSDSIALLFRKAIFEGELTGARTIGRPTLSTASAPAPSSATKAYRSTMRPWATPLPSLSRTTIPMYFIPWISKV